MDAAPPPTDEPHQPADPLAPNTANPPNVRATTAQAPKDDRFPADRGDTRPVRVEQICGLPQPFSGAAVRVITLGSRIELLDMLRGLRELKRAAASRMRRIRS